MTATGPVPSVPEPTDAADPLVVARLLDRALEEAQVAESAGGIPIGAVLVDRHGREVGAGHNRRLQHDDPTAHAELEALRSAGLAADLTGSVMVTTMTPCWMCSGAIAYLGVGTLIVGDSRSFDTEGADWLRARGVAVVAVDDRRCVETFAAWVVDNAELWRQVTGT